MFFSLMGLEESHSVEMMIDYVKTWSTSQRQVQTNWCRSMDLLSFWIHLFAVSFFYLFTFCRLIQKLILAVNLASI